MHVLPEIGTKTWDYGIIAVLEPCTSRTGLKEWDYDSTRMAEWDHGNVFMTVLELQNWITGMRL